MARLWKPWQAGLLIGILGGGAYLSSAAMGRNYPFGVTHGVLHVQVLITDSPLKHVYRKPPAPPAASAPSSPSAAPAPSAASTSSTASSQPAATSPAPKAVNWWLILLVVSFVFGAWVSGRLSGQARLLPKPPEQTVIAFLGGLLVGAGAGFGGGCVVGNIMSGWALMSAGMFVFGIATLLANWGVTYFYLMGGQWVGQRARP
jgi:hypothetical protein